MDRVVSPAYFTKSLADADPAVMDSINKELAREQSVVIQEIGEMGDMPDDLVFERFSEAAYPDQAFGRAVLGKGIGATVLVRVVMSNSAAG